VAKPNYHQAENRRNWPARRASRRSSNVAQLAGRSRREPEASQVEASVVTRRSEADPPRIDGARREPGTFQRRRTPGAHGAVASRPGSRAGTARRHSPPSNICVSS